MSEHERALKQIKRNATSRNRWIWKLRNEEGFMHQSTSSFATIKRMDSHVYMSDKEKLGNTPLFKYKP